MLKRVLLPLCLVLLGSCATNPSNNLISKEEKSFRLEDKNGEFLIKRKRIFKENKNILVVSRTIYSDTTATAKVLEKSATGSTPGLFKNRKMLRPNSSYYEVWFDGKKYLSSSKINIKRKSLEYFLDSPEAQWKGQREYPFPQDSDVFCYYNQVIECIGYTGFFESAIKESTGIKKFYIIWDGFPYYEELYLNMPNTPFEMAEMSFDGTTPEGYYRFSLKTGENLQFYFLNKNFEIKRHFWVAQGITIIDKES